MSSRSGQDRWMSHKRRKSSLQNEGIYFKEGPSSNLPHNTERRQGREVKEPLLESEKPEDVLEDVSESKQEANVQTPSYFYNYNVSDIPFNSSIQGVPESSETSFRDRSLSFIKPLEGATYEKARESQLPTLQYRGDPGSSPFISARYRHPNVQAPTSSAEGPVKPPPGLLQRRSYGVRRSPTSSRHKKDMSISSRFNLFDLSEPPDPGGTYYDRGYSEEILETLLKEINVINGTNVNYFLLNFLEKLGPSVTLDEFYQHLYGAKPDFNLAPQYRIDRSEEGMNTYAALKTIDLALEIFRSPMSIYNIFPHSIGQQITIQSINYQELIRNFLAIKFLKNSLIIISDDEGSLEHTISRLAIYKTYIIVCQKLVFQYPSPGLSDEQLNLVLGQSKFGKLLKLVYPNLVIKRLGSRGDSKYHYLGIKWNQSIMTEEIKNLCDKNDINDLQVMYRNVKRRHSGANHHTSLLKDIYIGEESKFRRSGIPTSEFKMDRLQRESFMSPRITFLDSSMKFCSPEVSVIFSEITESSFAFNKRHFYEMLHLSVVENNLTKTISLIFFKNKLIKKKESLCDLFTECLIKPLCEIQEDADIDLKVYMIVILELMPYLLFIEDYSHMEYLRYFRIGLSHLIETFATRLEEYKLNIFRQDTTMKFLSLMKKLLKLNDLLVTFVKIITDKQSPNCFLMAKDIKDYLVTSHEPYVTEIEVDFRRDVISKNIIQLLRTYEEDESSTENPYKIKTSSRKISENISSIQNFFEVDLYLFFKESEMLQVQTNQSYPVESEAVRSRIKLLLFLVHAKLLSKSITECYPIIIIINMVNIILNDTLKHVFAKSQEASGGQIDLHRKNTFENWWVFNSFITEYLSLIGELLGLSSVIEKQKTRIV